MTGHELYAEFTDYDSSQLDEWLREHILGNFTLSEMKDSYFEAKGNQRMFKGEAEWVVSHPKGLKAWLMSFGEKIRLCLIRQYLRLGSLSRVAWGQIQERPAGIHRRMVDRRNQSFP